MFEQLSIREHIFAIWLKKYELWISFIADKHKIRLNVIEFDYKAGELTVGLTNVIRYNDEPVYKDVHLDKFEFHVFCKLLLDFWQQNILKLSNIC